MGAYIACVPCLHYNIINYSSTPTRRGVHILQSDFTANMRENYVLEWWHIYIFEYILCVVVNYCSVVVAGYCKNERNSKNVGQLKKKTQTKSKLKSLNK